ncbi:MAG: signal peptidase II [Pseudomonadota bacterium]
MTGRLADLGALAAAWARDAKANPLFMRALAGAGLVAALDQASKFWIVHIVNLPERFRPCAKSAGECRQIALSPIFDLTYVENRGASFGMLAGGMGSRILLSAISLGVAAALVVWLGRLARPLSAAGVGLVVGGALGNLYDRIAYGFVVDFLDFTGLYFPWVFNVADAAINVGVALLILDAVFEARTPASG